MINQDLLSLFSNRQELSNILEPMPQYVAPVITQQDADKGFINRYFIRQANDKTFVVEVDSSQYYRLKSNPRFVGGQVKWKIIGKLETIKLQTGINLYGVKDSNRIAVADADLTFGGLTTYITDYGEYWLREN